MDLPSNPPATGLMGRLAGMVTAPRRTMASAARLGGREVLGTWVVVLAVWLGAGAWLLSTSSGRQALVDERVRVVEALGGSVDDGAYQALQARPPIASYFSSGGRTLLLPPVSLLVAAVLWTWLKRQTPRVSFLSTISLVVHASVILALQQVLATPLHAVRESLTSPFTLGALLPLFDEGSLPARFLGTIELFGLWWACLLAVGCSVLSGRPARGYLVPLLSAYAGIAAVIAGAVVLIGGS